MIRSADPPTRDTDPRAVTGGKLMYVNTKTGGGQNAPTHLQDHQHQIPKDLTAVRLRMWITHVRTRNYSFGLAPDHPNIALTVPWSVSTTRPQVPIPAFLILWLSIPVMFAWHPDVRVRRVSAPATPPLAPLSTNTPLGVE